MIILVVTLLALAGIEITVLLFELRNTGANKATGWAQAHGIALNDRSEPVVTRYLRTSRRLRRVCALGAVVTAAALSAAFGFPLVAWWPLWLLIGYLVGAFWAELALTPTPTDGPRVASLVPRTLADYLPTPLRRAQVAFPIVALVVAVSAVVRSAPTIALGALAFAFATTAAVLAAQWVLLRRPQPLRDPQLVAVDDAMRASAIHLLCGTGLTVVSLCIALDLELLARTTHGNVAMVVTSAAVGAVLVAEWAFAAWRLRPWQVRRVEAESAMAVGRAS